jgi:peptidoglycan hydrolase CwlO-like protein
MKKIILAVLLLTLVSYTAVGEVYAGKPPTEPVYATVEQVQQWLAELNTNLTAYIDTQIALVQSQAALLADRVTAVELLGASLQDQITLLVNRVTSTESTVTALDSQVDDHAIAISAMQTEFGRLNAEILSLNARVLYLEQMLGVGSSAPAL